MESLRPFLTNFHFEIAADLLDEEELDHILDPVRMTEPGISGKELLMKNNIDEK